MGVRFFKSVRTEIDEELANIPHQMIPCCLKDGIAPAMKADGRKTYWGSGFRNDTDSKVKKLPGGNLELQTPGSNLAKDGRKASGPRHH